MSLSCSPHSRLYESQITFSGETFLSLVVFSCLLLALPDTILFHFIDRQLHHDLGQRARIQAREIALMPGLAEKVSTRDITGIARLIQPLRSQLYRDWRRA